MANHKVESKNGNVFYTDNDSLAKSLKKQGHDVTVVADGEGDPTEAAPAKRSRSAKPKADAAPAAGDPTEAAPAADAASGV